MSYKDYFELPNLAKRVIVGEMSFSKAVEIAEMCLGVKMLGIPELNEHFSKSSEEYERAIAESALSHPEYLRRLEAIRDFEINFGKYAERDAYLERIKTKNLERREIK